jgi:hypothetical protein
LDDTAFLDKKDANSPLEDSVNLHKNSVTSGSTPDIQSPTPFSHVEDITPHDGTADMVGTTPHNAVVDVEYTTPHDVKADVGDATPHQQTVDMVNTTQDTSDIDDLKSAPVSTNRSSGKHTDFFGLSQMENQENDRLPLDRILNASLVRNHTFNVVESRTKNCSMITSMKFVFMLGRKLPLYIDVVCLIIGGIGVIGNVATIATVATNLKPRKPYYVAILILAVTDFLGTISLISAIFLEFEIS